MLDIVFRKYLNEAEELIFLLTQSGNISPLGDFVSFEEWEQLLSQYPIKKMTIHTSRKLYPLDVASLVTGPLEVFKRCQDKPDLNLNIILQEIKDASKNILG